MTRCRSGIIMSAMVALSGCVSPEVRYHTLVDPDAVRMTGSPSNFMIEVLPVGVPAQLDSQQIVVRQDSNRVVVLQNDRWLSPLGEEVQTALSARMTQQLHTTDVAGLTRDNTRPVIRVLMQVRRFDSWPGKNVALEADWSLSRISEGKRIRMVCHTRLSQTLSGDTAQMFTLWQGVMDMTADQIAQAARRWIYSGDATCPQT
ncbi:TPA: membrane integrity-associated transporter subunit PqiC [Klebsiella variicola]|nr:membrane integrity-associated transporter subunit PqiC [Klebsiella variicola]